MIAFASLQPIEKGWSGDRKYRAESADGRRLLLRVSPAEREARRRESFRMQRRAWEMGVPAPEPIEIGECREGIYTLEEWIDGRDAEDALPSLAEEEQYRLGAEAGNILRTIHTIPAPQGLPAWEERYNAKIDRRIAAYRACPVHFPGDGAVTAYIEANRGLLHGRPQTSQHGDYHTGNMMLAAGRLVVIDFDRCDWGDPWEEFNRISWCAQLSPAFASGMADGYFGGPPPEVFWRLLALYICTNALSSLPWAIPFGEGEVRTMLRQAADILAWYDGMQTVIPGWYSRRYM